MTLGKVILIGLVSMLCCIGQSFAASRSFPGMEIIPRSERGATESRRYFSPKGYTDRLARTKRYTDRLAGSGEDTTGAWQKRKEREEIQTARGVFLEEDYPEERVIDRTIREVEGKRLLWGLSYNAKKTKIVLHHTVTRYPISQDDAMNSIKEIYKQHAIKQSRGDIGYHFLIDPLGHIYEGRAGGKDIIAAHADWNNTTTIGIALLGNYDLYDPSLRMLLSLKKMLLAVMLQYDIDPLQKQSYFTPINEDPWLEVHTHDSIVGHSDTKNTACPGVHIEDRLASLREQMHALKNTLAAWKKDSITTFRFLPKKMSFWMNNDYETTTYRLPNRVIRDCKLFGGEGIKLEQCGGNGEDLVVSISRITKKPSGQYILLVDTDAGAVWIDLVVVWQQQLDDLYRIRQQTNALPTAVQQMSKIEKKISGADLTKLMQTSVGVLLYEPTTTMQDREFQCESGCEVVLDDRRIKDVRMIRVQPSGEDENKLTVFLDLQKYTAASVQLVNPRSVITIINRQRGTQLYPLNYFRGDIMISKQAYSTVEKTVLTGWTIVNTLPVDQYLRGIAETVEMQHPEKLHAMALLVKSYTLFYLGENRHPSVPAGVNYQAIDDPRLFQKYVGAGIEQTTPLWQASLTKTAGEYILYKNYLPILPYFHCSAGLTRSGNERFGWIDTPRLVGTIDVQTCESGGFEGHGVGLSGDGAQKLAEVGASYKQILRYYYENITIEKL